MKAQRQGDVIFILNGKIPIEAKKLEHLVIAEGELTGHKHEVVSGQAELYEYQGTLFLRVISNEAIVGHPEHKKQVLLNGEYQIDLPQEYDYVTEEARKLQD